MSNNSSKQQATNRKFDLSNSKSPSVRRKLSGPGFRAFQKIADRWNLSRGQKLGLLGFPNRQTYMNWEEKKIPTFNFDTLTRFSLIIGIYKALHILYPEENFADAWVKMPNSNPLFQGKPAIDYMASGSIDNLFRVRRLLDARRGTWS